MSPRKRHWICAAAAGVHIIIVVLGASRLGFLAQHHPLTNTLRVYQAYTGADAGYDFFAPSVATQLRAAFQLTTPGGERVIRPVLQNREAQLRLDGIINFFWHPDLDKDAQRALAASWASKYLSENKDAEKVEVILEQYHLPSMKAWENGELPAWRPYYNATFRRQIEF